MRGFIFYDGPSLLDGSPILGIVANLKGKRVNQKTGNMVQTYILTREASPVEARRTGADWAICGDCVHAAKTPNRPHGQGTCYVRPETGPLIVWKAATSGRYPRVTPQEAREILAGRIVRLGAYGDPAAIPFMVWETLLAHAADWTGYTHQWKQPTAEAFKRFVMASCDNADEYHEARSQGWRAFYVVPKGFSTGKPAGAFLCPASEEAGKKLHCVECTACNGTAGKATASVFIPVHGVAFKQARFNALVQIERGRGNHVDTLPTV